MIARFEQRKQRRPDGSHASAKAHCGQSFFHLGHFSLERFDGRADLPAVGVPCLLALKNGG